MSHDQQPVHLVVNGYIGEVILNRPKKRNALNIEAWNLLKDIFEQCAKDSRVEIVILRGADLSVFSAGADISEFETVRANASLNREYSAVVKSAVMSIKNLAKPVIAMVSGYCVGGGTELAVACDLRFGSDTLKMGITPAKLGFVYDVEETKMLVDLVGPSHAKDILFSARLLDAPEAHHMGLIDRIVPKDMLVATTRNYIDKLLRNAPQSIRGAKAIINGIVAGSPDDPQLKQIVSDSLDSRHYQEGVKAFIDKRRPDFLSIPE